VRLAGSILFGGSLGLRLWMLNVIPGEQIQGGFRIALFDSFMLRIAVEGGATAYLLADAPRRIRGPLGWRLLRFTLAGAATLVTWKAIAVHPERGLPACASVTLLAPLTLVMIAFHRAPAEAPEDTPRLSWA
jgi:hypothetical protein